MKKTFAGGSKTVKFVKVFSFESFPLYGISSATFLIAGQQQLVELTIIKSCVCNGNVLAPFEHGNYQTFDRYDNEQSNLLHALLEAQWPAQWAPLNV